MPRVHPNDLEMMVQRNQHLYAKRLRARHYALTIDEWEPGDIYDDTIINLVMSYDVLKPQSYQRLHDEQTQKAA